MEDRCVVCGEIVPEGTHICPMCQQASNDNNVFEYFRSLTATKSDRETCQLMFYFAFMLMDDKSKANALRVIEAHREELEEFFEKHR